MRLGVYKEKDGKDMGKNIDKIRKKIASRRKRFQEKAQSAPQFFSRHDEARDEPDFYYYQDRENRKPNWEERDSFLLRTLTAIVLFFAVAILFQNGSATLDGARHFISEAYKKEFNFAAISNWYETQFGRPLALIPREHNIAIGDVELNPEIAYAVPASGQIRESFEQNGKGILVETEEEYVEAVRSGFVISVGQQENSGKTIGIEHYDGSESWYGMLSEVEVKLYDHIEVGKPVGKVTVNEETGKGIFYFSLKQGDDYINPNDVISFD